MAKVFKGFNIHLESKAKVKALRDILDNFDACNNEEEAELAQEIIEAIDEKVEFDND